MKKIIFFDLDNTIYSTKRQMFLPNTLKMLENLSKQKDIILGLATGRAPHKVPMLEEVKQYFSYFIYVNGGLGFTKDKLKLKSVINKKTVKKIIRKISEFNVPVGLVGFKNEYITYYDETVMKDLKGFNNHNPLIYNEKTFNDDVFQIWFFTNDKDKLNEIKSMFNNLTMYPWHYGGADLTNPANNKACAIKKMIKKEKNYQLICIGDGFNDLEMIKLADIGIAMENSGFDILKQNADYIAPHIEADLLYEYLIERKII